MNIKKAIEVQRTRIDRMAKRSENLIKLLYEAQKMDRLVEAYESRKTNMSEKQTGLLYGILI